MGGVLSGSLLIAWATEVLSFFLSRGMAFAVLALLQVLPEFAVEAVITLEAAADPTNLQYVTANFTGANRLIVGLFLPMVFFMAAYRARRLGSKLNAVRMPVESSIEIVALIVATLYSFTFVVRGSVGFGDAVILVGIYVTYLFLTYKLPPSDSGDHEELPLVPRKIRTFANRNQKLTILAFFALGGWLLYISVHPFFVNTLALGAAIGISSYFLLQWMAPFLSEFPEFITIVYWGKTGRAQLGLTNAISSKVNQWTLLIAMIPIVYGFGTWKAGRFSASLIFDETQQLEILLTAVQGLFAAAAFMNLRFHRWEAITLVVLWGIQLFDPLIDPLLPSTLPYFFEPTPDPTTGEAIPHYIREWTTLAYLLLTPVALLLPKNRWAAFKGFRQMFRTYILQAPMPPAPPASEAEAPPTSESLPASSSEPDKPSM